MEEPWAMVWGHSKKETRTVNRYVEGPLCSAPSLLCSLFFRAEQTSSIPLILLRLKWSHFFFCGSVRHLSFPPVICLQHSTRIMLRRGGQGKRIINHILRVCINRNCKWCQRKKSNYLISLWLQKTIAPLFFVSIKRSWRLVGDRPMNVSFSPWP